MKKKNGLTLLPSTSGGDNNSSSIITKKNETIVRSAVLLRRMEYNEKLNKQPQKIDSYKVVIIQRHWRQYYLSVLLKMIKIIQRNIRKDLNNNRNYKLLSQWKKIDLLIKKKLYRKYFSLIFIKTKKKRNYAIRNREVNVYLKADEKKRKAEESLKILFNLDTNCNNINTQGIKSFPRLKQEINNKILKRINRSEISIQKEIDINIRNNDNIDCNISFISDIDDYARTLGKIIPKKISYAKWNMITIKRSSFFLFMIKLIQRRYKRHNCKASIIHRMNRSSLAIFVKIVQMTISKRRLIISKERLIKLLSELCIGYHNKVDNSVASFIDNHNNHSSVVAVENNNDILNKESTPTSNETDISYNPIKSKLIIDDFSFNDSVIDND